MSVKYKVMASTGTYTDANGQEKKRWMQCGIVLAGKTGNLSLKLEAMPVGEWNGWFSLFEPDTDSKPQRQHPRRDDGDDSDIPF